MATAGWPKLTACISPNSLESWIWVCWRVPSRIIRLTFAGGNATDGLIPALDLFALEDDRHYFPPYEAVPVIREQALQEHPEVARLLGALGNKISD